jgi:O-antigen ligase
LSAGKDNILKYYRFLTFLFLGLAVISSQFSIASSSIGVGGIIILLAAGLFLERESFRIDRNLLVLFGLFILAQLISSLFSTDPYGSVIQVLKRISLYSVFFAVIVFFKNREQLKKFLLYFFIFSAIVSVTELIRFAIDYVPASDNALTEYRLSYFGYPVTNGQIKMMILLLIIPFMLVKENYIAKKYILLLLSLPILVTFYLTNARNAVLGIFAGLLLLGILRNRKFLLGLLTLVAVFLIIAPDGMKDRILSIGDFKHPSNVTRFVIWETGMKIIKDKPVLGFGEIDFKELYSRYKTPERHGESSHMHNTILQILVNFGLLGLLAWFLLMLYLFLNQLKVYFKTKNDEFLNILALVSVVSMISLQICGLTEWNFGDAELAAVFWFNLALAFAARKLGSLIPLKND